MASYVLRDVDRDTIHTAKARARQEETSIDALLRGYLDRYAAGAPADSTDAAARAGRARWADRTPEERSAHAQMMVRARQRRSSL